jgi:hypothetical protein
VRVVIGGITMRFGISTRPIRAGVRRMLMIRRDPLLPEAPLAITPFCSYIS